MNGSKDRYVGSVWIIYWCWVKATYIGLSRPMSPISMAIVRIKGSISNYRSHPFTPRRDRRALSPFVFFPFWAAFITPTAERHEQPSIDLGCTL